mmetsp:Transcript_20891/g.30253  ORF Transcript_20891/g.30253 Transcript_20891/m.30253 type:complete len:85 (-) Transcript_20891:667-921(-)
MAEFKDDSCEELVENKGPCFTTKDVQEMDKSFSPMKAFDDNDHGAKKKKKASSVPSPPYNVHPDFSTKAGRAPAGPSLPIYLIM